MQINLCKFDTKQPGIFAVMISCLLIRCSKYLITAASSSFEILENSTFIWNSLFRRRIAIEKQIEENRDLSKKGNAAVRRRQMMIELNKEKED